MANAGAGGAAGGAVGGTIAVTRVDVIDPHVLIMMRDVMGTTETAPRLKVQGAAAGGGGGGGGAGGSGTDGQVGEQPTTATIIFLKDKLSPRNRKLKVLPILVK